ncbi:uncharacterized protein LOC134278550 [Saccostrea cucullata]|uniref:uncharacterized protein LOC134242686 n=1 Tax=Saccostrea cuccullata TaxID=36930 RepID=UPI002ED0514E
MYIQLTLTDPVTKQKEEGCILISRTHNTEKGITEQEVKITDPGCLCIMRIMVKSPFEIDKQRYPKIGKFFRDSDRKMKIINRLQKVLKRLFFKMCLQAMMIVKMNEYTMVKLYEEICFSDIRVFALLILRMSTWREIIVDINGTKTTNLREILQVYACPEENSANICDETFLMQMSLCNYIQDRCGDKSEIGHKADKLLELVKDTLTNNGHQRKRMELIYGRQGESTIVFCS